MFAAWFMFLTFATGPQDEPLGMLAYQGLRRDVKGMTAEWGIAGPVERRAGAQERVKRVGPKAVPALVKMLEDRDHLVQAGALIALGFFPERAAVSVPPLLRRLQQSEERFDLQSVGETLDKLLPRNQPLPPELVKLLASDVAYRRMIAVKLVLPRQPQNKEAQQALLRSLRQMPAPVRGGPDTGQAWLLPASFWSDDTCLVAAWHAIFTLEALPEADRRFAQADLERIAGFPATPNFSEFHRFCEYVRAMRAQHGK